MEIATIGFTQSSAEHFFGRIRGAGIRRLVDVRLNNVSQLAGFAKSNDLSFFLDRLCNTSYEHDVRLAPTAELLDAYRAKEIAWGEYEVQFQRLMVERGLPDAIDRSSFAHKTVLLCSEATAEKCHRRLVAELLATRWHAKVEHL